jgi:CBS domain-containing protein
MNPIAERIQEFLKSYPPFSFLPQEDLRRIAHKSLLRYCKEGEIVFLENAAPLPHFFVLYKGSVKLEKVEDKAVFDWAEVGDCFGVRAMLTGNPYALRAQCVEDCLLLEIDSASFKNFLNQSPQALQFFAAGLAAGTLLVGDQMSKVRRSFDLDTLESQGQTGLEYYRKEVHCIASHATLKEAAEKMVKLGISALVVGTSSEPMGILTDKDLRKALAYRAFPGKAKVEEAMSAPLISLSQTATVWDAQWRMMKNKIRHLALREGEDFSTPLVGILSEHDLLQAKNSSPASLIKNLQKTDNPLEWAQLRERWEQTLVLYLGKGVPIHHLCQITALFNDALLEKCLKKAQESLLAEEKTAPQGNFCWLILGSNARQENLLRTDQDHALIYEEGLGEHAKSYFLKLATHVSNLLETCGFEKCPAEVMASNPKWCLSLGEWKKQFAQWIRTPDPQSLMHCTIFFDFRPLEKTNALGQQLRTFVQEEIQKTPSFLNFLAGNALQNPPALTWWKGLQTDNIGEKKDLFDLKARALMPLIDAARLLALQHNFSEISSTAARFKKAAEVETHYESLLLDCLQSFEILLKLRAQTAFKNQSSGRYLAKDQLSPLEKSILKKSFQPLNEWQKIISLRFQTDLLS